MLSLVSPPTDHAVEVIRVATGDEVDDAGSRLGSVEQALPAFEHFDALDHAGGQRVGHGARIKAVVDADAVDQQQDVCVAGALQRDVHMRRAAARSDEQARHFHLHRLLSVDEHLVADFLGSHDFKVGAVFLKFLREGFLDGLAL